MFKGFYNLTSGMVSQGRRLDVISNNMANVSTSGYKADTYTDSTFREYMVSRVGNKDKRNSAEIGPASYILAPSQLYTDYAQGSLEQTGMPLDFAIEGDGFFAVHSGNGVAYTRAGSFALDDEGYLCQPDGSRILDPNGEEISLGTDKIHADASGVISTEDGLYLGQIGVYSFADNAQLQRNAQGYFTGGGAQAATGASLHWKTQERSNIDLIQQMTGMMTAQRAFQSAAEVSKMYDQLMTKAATNLGNV
ncbi:Flagellar basal-body rod protein FlgG [anaerobic digester metagenome]|uniref:flagellar hook-basal body protein n=1 Tax=Oscillibacter ruminantium TaxID=1263547 RepID=UPI002B20EA0E|nr:flagellar hook-basal body protein [Oscillibacter ruminantium]MEA5041279.1 flagellar hook-basal body protein [Oscillibacter ruminantium]